MLLGYLKMSSMEIWLEAVIGLQVRKSAALTGRSFENSFPITSAASSIARRHSVSSGGRFLDVMIAEKMERHPQASGRLGDQLSPASWGKLED